jgi:carbamoyl-phosphate synthase small subunit
LSPTQTAYVALENGRVFRGYAFGATGRSAGEAVFNTSLSGYQEIFTDPSYRGQIVVMTCPQVGNTGINSLDMESHRPWLSGVVVRELSPRSSNWRSEQDLAAYLAAHGVIGVGGVDTRALTLELRERGALRAVLACGDSLDPDRLVAEAAEHPGLEGRDLVREVSREQPERYDRGGDSWFRPVEGAGRYRVVAYDFGIKTSILRRLVDHGCDVTVVPAATSARQVLALEPDGVFLSNGPGDPAPLAGIIEQVRALIGKRPLFGICLGHQILALALGGRTYKLKFGHHGGNHPVKNLLTGGIEITAQNHGFAVEPDSLPPDCEPTLLNLNDRTLEGFRHRELPLMAVQYHPESSPGPHDSHYLFEEFTRLMDGQRPVG